MSEIPDTAPSTTGSSQPLTSRQYLAQQAVAPQQAASAAYDEAEAGESESELSEENPNMADETDPSLELPGTEPQKSRIAPGMYRPMPEMLVLEWASASRPFKKRSKRFFTTIVVIGLLISLILFFAGQVLPVAVVFSIIFLVYVFSVIPPNTVTHAITTFGIRIDTELYYWEELGRFWFETKHDQPMVHIEMARFPGRLTMLLGDQAEATLRSILAEVLLEEQPPLTQFEKIAKWLEQHIPLDID